MKNTIWKFPLDITDEQVIFLPEDSTPLHVGVQDEVLYVWVLLDTTDRFIEQTVHIYGTGNPIVATLPEYSIGSVQMGPFVWHVFWVMS